MRALKLVEQIADPEIAETESWDSRLQIALLAPNGVQKLRELILELAIRGKLVPQNSKEESAKDLLARIKNEKEKLSKIGAVKKEKDRSSKSSDEGKFKIPKGWSWCRFADISSYIQRGKGPDYVEKSDYPVLSQKCVRWYGLDLSKARFISKKSLEKYDEIRFLKAGDVLWNSTGTGTIGRASVVPKIDKHQKLVVDSHVTIIRPVLINPEYLWRWIQSPTVQKQIEGSASGSTNQIELSTTTVLSHLIPLPPLPEQDRIVSKINELMALCDALEVLKTEAAGAHETLLKTLLGTLTQSQDAREFQENWQRIAKNFNILFTTEASIDALKQTILQLAVMGKLVPQSKKEISVESKIIEFSKHNKNKSKAEFVEDQNTDGLPENWCLTAFANMISLINYGTSKKCIPDPAKTPVFRIPNILNGKIDHGDLKHASFSKTELKKLALEEGDILIIRSNGSLSLVGQAAVVEEKDINSLYAGYLIRIRALKSIIYPRFLTLQLSSPNMRKKIESFGRSTSGVNNINSRQIASLNIYIPPLEEQKRIVSKVDELISICDGLKDRLTKFNSLHEQLAIALVEKAVAA